MANSQFQLKKDQDFIELIKLLKIEGIAQTGGHGKILIEEGEIKVNDEVEFRKRRKLRNSDRVQFEDLVIEIVY